MVERTTIRIPGRDIDVKTRKRPGLWCKVFKIWCMVHSGPQGAADNDYICSACIKRGGPAKQTARRHGRMLANLRGLDIPKWKWPRDTRPYRQRAMGRRVA